MPVPFRIILKANSDWVGSKNQEKWHLLHSSSYYLLFPVSGEFRYAWAQASINRMVRGRGSHTTTRRPRKMFRCDGGRVGMCCVVLWEWHARLWLGAPWWIYARQYFRVSQSGCCGRQGTRAEWWGAAWGRGRTGQDRQGRKAGRWRNEFITT